MENLFKSKLVYIDKYIGSTLLPNGNTQLLCSISLYLSVDGVHFLLRQGAFHVPVHYAIAMAGTFTFGMYKLIHQLNL